MTRYELASLLLLSLAFKLSEFDSERRNDVSVCIKDGLVQQVHQLLLQHGQFAVSSAGCNDGG